MTGYCKAPTQGCIFPELQLLQIMACGQLIETVNIEVQVAM